MTTNNSIGAIAFVVGIICVYPVFAQDIIEPVKPLPDYSDDLWCKSKVKSLINKQYVTDKAIIEKRQSLPDYMKVTMEDFKNVKDNVRIVLDGEMMTMDANPERLTVIIDEYNFILNAYCG